MVYSWHEHVTSYRSSPTVRSMSYGLWFAVNMTPKVAKQCIAQLLVVIHDHTCIYIKLV